MGITPELISYYESRISMFADTAWKDLMVDVKAMMEATNNLNNVSDEKSLHFKKGELSIMQWLVSLEQVSRDAYDELRSAEE